nr:hypothetical protein [Tanacetum cinerariifolium]
MKSSFLSKPPESSSQPKGEQTKIYKGKKVMYSKDAEEESTESDYDDKTTHVPGSTIESSKKKELKRKGPITLKVYREDDTSEINPEFKASDLNLGEWREVVTAFPNKKGEGWTSIYKKIHERIDYLRTTKVELGINLDRPLSEQDPLDRLNDLTNKKRKHADDIHDFFRANKRLKSSVQYKDHPTSTLLNEHVLEIFFRLHQGPGIDDHARTFSSLLLAEIDKRNLNPLKHTRVIEQLRL